MNLLPPNNFSKKKLLGESKNDFVLIYFSKTRKVFTLIIVSSRVDAESDLVFLFHSTVSLFDRRSYAYAFTIIA